MQPLCFGRHTAGGTDFAAKYERPWITLYPTSTRGVNGECSPASAATITAGTFQQHRLAIAGSGAPIYCAQLQLNVDNTGPNEV